MGRDKAQLEIAGEPLLTRQIRLVREIGAKEVLISVRARKNHPRPGCRVIQDKFSDAGPLSGIERALHASTSALVLVLAVDMPKMSADFLGRLLARCSENSGAIPRLGRYVEPLAAFYPKVAHDIATALLDGNSPRAGNFAECCVARNFAAFVNLSAIEAGYFANWNAPNDLKDGEHFSGTNRKGWSTSHIASWPASAANCRFPAIGHRENRQK